MKKLTTSMIILCAVSILAVICLWGTTQLETMDQTNKTLEFNTISLSLEPELESTPTSNLYLDDCMHIGESSDDCKECNPKPQVDPFLSESLHVSDSDEDYLEHNSPKEITCKLYRLYHEGEDKYYIAEYSDSMRPLEFNGLFYSLVPEEDYVFNSNPKYSWTYIIKDIITIEKWNSEFNGKNGSNNTLDEIIEHFLTLDNIIDPLSVSISNEKPNL